MYERVWEGSAPGLDGAEWDLFLDFNQDTGLFRVGGSLDGEHSEMWECADPVASRLMARSATDRPSDHDIMALIPPAPLKMKGRFAPFSSPDQIVAGTWRTPRDWPEARKDEAVKELRMRRSDIVRLPNEPDPDRLVIQECSRLLNGMYGDPTRWPRRAVDVALGYPRGTKPGSKYNDPGLWGITLPPEFSAAVVGFGSALKGKALGYRDAVYALYEKAKSNGLYIEKDWEDHFGVIPSADATRFVRELSEGDTVTLSLAASFSRFGNCIVELGDVRVDLKSANWYRDKFKSCEFSHGPLNVQNLGKLPLQEFSDYLRNCHNGRLYTRWAGAFLDGEYGMDLEGKADRVLISAMAFDEWDSHDDYGLHHKALAWEVISWSKSEGAYHVETWQAPKYLDGSHKSSEQSWKEYDRTFDSFPSEKMPDMRNMPMTMSGEPEAFVNARYAYDPDRLLKGHARKDTQVKTVPGTKALKANLSKLDRKANVNRAQGNGNRGHHV